MEGDDVIGRGGEKNEKGEGRAFWNRRSDDVEVSMKFNRKGRKTAETTTKMEKKKKKGEKCKAKTRNKNMKYRTTLSCRRFYFQFQKKKEKNANPPIFKNAELKELFLVFHLRPLPNSSSPSRKKNK